jgi:serine/threonine-protein kinase RCK2
MPASQPAETVRTPEERKAAAEAIVSQEREAKSKLPVFKGMENFQLQEKMGEYV